jgi:hypothetical protein
LFAVVSRRSLGHERMVAAYTGMGCGARDRVVRPGHERRVPPCMPYASLGGGNHLAMADTEMGCPVVKVGGSSRACLEIFAVRSGDGVGRHHR